jgi:hypothetical protein
MKKSIALILIILLNISFFISCGGSASKIAKLVPEDAVLFVQAVNPDGVFEEVDQFLKVSKLNTLSGGKSSKMVFSEIIATAGLSIEQIDTTQPVGMVILMKGGFEPEPQTAMLLPIVADTDVGSLERSVAPMGMKVKKIDNYAVFTDSEELFEKYPLDKNLDLSSLSKYEENSVTMYIGMKTIMEKFGPIIKGTIGMAKGMIGPETYGTAMEPAMAETMGKLVDFYFELVLKIIDIVKNVKNITYCVSVDEEGAEILSTTDVFKDNYVADFISAAGTEGDLKDYTKYLPENYMMTGISNINPEAVKTVSDAVIDMLAVSDLIKEADTAGLKKISENMLDSMGYKSAFAFDMKFDTEMLTGMSTDSTLQDPGDLKSILGDAVQFNLICVYELKDAGLMRDTMRESLNGGLITGVVNDIYRDLGMKISISLREKVVENGFEYDIVSYDLDISGLLESSLSGASLEDKFQMQLMNEMISAMMENFNLYIHYTDNQCFMTMGGEGPGFLKSLVGNDSYTNGNISESEAFSSVLENISADSNYFFQISIPSFVNMFVSSVSEGNAVLDMPNTTGLVSYGKFKDSKMEGIIRYPSNEIAWLVTNMGTFMTLGM